MRPLMNIREEEEEEEEEGEENFSRPPPIHVGAWPFFCRSNNYQIICI
jgi:hypothetical protein